MHQAKGGASRTTDYYQVNALEYFEKNVSVDPSSFLLPLAGRLKVGASVLDVGCGSGRYLLWLKSRGFAATGFERSPALAEMARRHARCTVIEGDFAHHDFSAFSADAVILIGALVHLPHELFAGVLRSIAAALKAGGPICGAFLHPLAWMYLILPGIFSGWARVKSDLAASLKNSGNIKLRFLNRAATGPPSTPNGRYRQPLLFVVKPSAKYFYITDREQ
jgi:SAM-dependent methyltransferase